MLLPDVNILVYADREEFADHERCRDWLHELINGPSAFAMSELVLSGFVRVVTNPRTFKAPTPVDEALAFTEAILSRNNCVRVFPGQRHYAIFAELCREAAIRGPDVSDAYHAATAIEHGCEWITTDKGFRRFAGLRWSTPF